MQPTSTATTVCVREGKLSTTDGPFAETKEQLGGFYLVEAKDQKEAAAMAAKIPGARFGFSGSAAHHEVLGRISMAQNVSCLPYTLVELGLTENAEAM